MYDFGTVDDIHELGIAVYSSLLPDKNVGRNSDNWARIRATAGLIADLHAHLDANERDRWADTAGEATIERIGKTYGVIRKGATPASGENAGKVKGTNGSSWTTNDVLLHTSGLRFRASVGGTLGAPGEALVGIVAIDTGPATRLTKGEVLTWEVTPSGLENEVELQVDLSTGGEDKEEIGAYRTRILNRLAQPAQGGNANDWEQWVVESADYVASGYVWPNRNGRGSVDVAGLRAGSGSVRLLDASERTALLAYVNSKRPVTAQARVLEVITQAQNVEVIFEPKRIGGAVPTQFARDWSPEVQMTVSAWNAGTRQLTFGQARPASMAVGHRLVIFATSGVVLEIESLVSTNAVILKDALGQTPASPNNVYPAGPLTDTARNAILALFDSLGPRLGSYGQGTWESTLLVTDLEDASKPEGVRDATLVTPTVNVEPTAETLANDPQVRLLIPGNVLARYLL